MRGGILSMRTVLVGLAAVFSAYHVVLAFSSLPNASASALAPVMIAIALYLLATVLSLVALRPLRLPAWVAVFDLAVAIAIPLLVTSVLDPHRRDGNGYATWYVAAVGTLLTICAARGRGGFGWAGIVFLVVQTTLWSGPLALIALGVIGSAAWVGVANIITLSLARAARDRQRFAIAEREAAEWQAAQSAHLIERQFRLGQTGAMALPMLRRIRATGGELSEAERRECRYLEGAIRDEIRGRRLLDDGVREQVMLARRRGTAVTLLDEGGIDELDDASLRRVWAGIAEALRASRADKVIVRTVPEGSDVAVTVVGLRTPEDASAALGPSDEDDEVDLWLEIPRIVEERPARTGAEMSEGPDSPARPLR